MIVQLDIGPEDFQQLALEGLPWAGTELASQAAEGRFNRPRDPTPIGGRWKYAYWMESYASAILARAWLVAQGHTYDLVWDEGNGCEDHSIRWVVLTDYRDDFLIPSQPPRRLDAGE